MTTNSEQVKLISITPNAEKTIAFCARVRIAMKTAFARGYRVDPSTGYILSPTGFTRKPKLYGKQRYASTSITITTDGHKRKDHFSWHKFAAFCYFGEQAFYLHVRHLNGNTLDNTRANLALGTAKDNENDKCPLVKSRAAKIARSYQDRPGNAKLNPDLVREIRASQESGAVLGKRYGVHRSVIHFVKSRRSWKDVS